MRIIKYHNCSHGKQHQTKQYKNPPDEFLMFDNGVYPETEKAKCENEKLKDQHRDCFTGFLLSGLRLVSLPVEINFGHVIAFHVNDQVADEVNPFHRAIADGERVAIV